MMASRGYDMTPTMYSPDGRIYQVEYAIETVKRGTLAIGVLSKEGVIMAVEEKPRALQTTNVTQKITIIEVTIITKLVHTHKKRAQTTERVSHDLVDSLKLWTKRL